MSSFFRSLLRALDRARGSSRSRDARHGRRLLLVESLEERRLLSGGLGPILRFAEAPTPGNVRVRLNPNDPRTIQVSDNGSPFQDVALGIGATGAPQGAFVVAGPKVGGSSPVLFALVDDFNQDGIPDLAFNFGATVSVLLGQADGTFLTTFQFSHNTLTEPLSVAVGDFNGDGIPDLLMVSSLGPSGSSTLSLMFGNSDGSYRMGEDVQADPTLVAHALANLPAGPQGSMLWRQGDTPVLSTGSLLGLVADLEALSPAPAAGDSQQTSPAPEPAPVNAPGKELPPDLTPEDDSLSSKVLYHTETAAADTPRSSAQLPEPFDEGGRAETSFALAGKSAEGLRAETASDRSSATAAGTVVAAGRLPAPPESTHEGTATDVSPAESPAAAVNQAPPSDSRRPEPAQGPSLLGELGDTEPGPDMPVARQGRKLLAPLPRDAGPVALEGSPPSNPRSVSPRGQPLSLNTLGRLLAQALYLGNFKRPASGSRDAGAEQAALDRAGDTRLLVADLIQRSTETLTRVVQGFYLLFLGRLALAGEENGWVAMLLAGQTQEQVLGAFLATAEFYDRADTLVPNGTRDERFLQALSRLLLRRPATSEELSGWLAALPALGRGGVASALLASAEYRSLQVASYHEELLQRPGTPAEVAGWAEAPFDLLTIRQHLTQLRDSLPSAVP